MARTQSLGSQNQMAMMDVSDLVSLRQAQRLDMYSPRLPHYNGSAPGHGNYRHRSDRFRDVIEWQFWPKSISMGTTSGNVFVQVSLA